MHQNMARKSWINKEAFTNDFSTWREGGRLANSFLTKDREVV